MSFDVFALNEHVIRTYETFARSFTKIRSDELREKVEALYRQERLWPEPMLALNPHYKTNLTIADLVARGDLDPECSRVFVGRDGAPMTLRQHQEEAISLALERRSFVVTTGTGSGKSLCFFAPIIDDVLKLQRTGVRPSTKAIIIYPMNALANSQYEELKRYLDGRGVSFARYTGQESDAERDSIAETAPDILLTNFMMLELIMTRQSDRDRQVIENCRGLRFIVLDELHTYRGRQGADVAMLMRRLRARTADGAAPLCIGTSATMSSEGDAESRSAAVAGVASRLFGTTIHASDVVTETLTRVTDDWRCAADGLPELPDAVRMASQDGRYDGVANRDLKGDSLAIWIETRIGLSGVGTGKIERAKPETVRAGAVMLSEDTGLDPDICRRALVNALRAFSLSEAERGVIDGSEEPLFAFKLHQFVSGAGRLYCTVAPASRSVTFDGQIWDPSNAAQRLYATHFCRNCGQEHHPVFFDEGDGDGVFLRREIDDVPLKDEDSDGKTPAWGFLMPEPADGDFRFTGDDADYPEMWLEESRQGSRLKPTFRKNRAKEVLVAGDGRRAPEGRRMWFLPGRFSFCPACGEHHMDSTRDINRLASLSAEGRSSATTVLIAAVLSWMNAEGHVPDDISRKLLAFTDNRQDAALQAGHFNDFVFVTLLRAATLAALEAAGDDGLGEDELGAAVQRALGFVAANVARRAEWLFEADLKGANLLNAEKAVREALAYRCWVDQRRGWRFTNPNLEQLGLVGVEYVALDEMVADEGEFASEPLLSSASPAERRAAALAVLEHMRRGLAVDCDALDRQRIDALQARMRGSVRPPWAIDDQRERLPASAVMLPAAPPRRALTQQDETTILRGGPQSLAGRELRRLSFAGQRPNLNETSRIIETILQASRSYGLASPQVSPFGGEGWKVQGNAIRFRRRQPEPHTRGANAFFCTLYEEVAHRLLEGGGSLFGYEAREHTAQVEGRRRQIREARFRFTKEDRDNLEAQSKELQEMRESGRFLPTLVCSPTMELGVDISAMNVVYLRNVPPTPANYAQRGGRSGRSGQAALVLTYCAAQSPHDQYYFRDPAAMVSGVVRAPSIDLASRDLVQSHAQAEWLSATGLPLDSAIPLNLDMAKEDRPLPEASVERIRSVETRAIALARVRAVLGALEADFGATAPRWFSGVETLAAEIVDEAPSAFADAFGRWRTLLASAERQMEEAHRVMNDHQAPSSERANANRRHQHGFRQKELLLGGSESLGSDFYTYRYLATEGFLPGYNFPRLPLMAFVPGDEVGGKQRFIQRARFLAIAEFGPGSLVYHEGRAYRVDRALLKEAGAGPEGKLPTQSLWICGECGAAHAGETPEDCHVCGQALGGAELLRDLYRIENVSTRAAERITANDEERRRQGFELQTTFSFRDSAERAAVSIQRDGKVVASGVYASAALIRRINKGLRRRKDPHEIGFMIDPRTGAWRGAAEDDADSDPTRRLQRITPVVEDQKNGFLLRLPADLSARAGEHAATVVATVQHALIRGVERVFELEEGELLVEPTPSRQDRRALFFYEAAEGGAGALARLAREPRKMAEVGRAALALMHYEAASIEAAIERGADHLVDEGDGVCVAGCYRCLLSYFNQPDHELIDRRHPLALELLIDFAAGDLLQSEAEEAAEDAPCGSDGCSDLPAGTPPPDATSEPIGGVDARFVWRRRRVCAVEAAKAPSDVDERMADLGFSVVLLPPEGDARRAAILRLVGLLREHVA